MPRKRSVPQEPHNPSTPDNGGVKEPGYDAQLAALFAPAFAIIPGRALTDDRLSSFDFRVLAVMCGHANRTDRLCWPKQETLAQELRATRPGISGAISRLITYGYVVVQRRGFPASNVYRMVFDEPVSPLQMSTAIDPRCQPPLTPDVNSGLPTNRNREQEQRTPSYSRESYKRNIQATPQSGARESVPVSQVRTTEEPPAVPAITRDPLYLALVACLGYDPTPGTRAFKKWTVAVNDLRRNGATAADIPRAISAYQSAYPRADVTPLALANNWPRLREGKSHGVQSLTTHQRTSEVLRATHTSDPNDPETAERERAERERRAAIDREIQQLYATVGVEIPTDGGESNLSGLPGERSQ